MVEQRQKHNIHIATLISGARLKMGFATLKDLYRKKKPLVDYQTWLHTEAGRRIPTPTKLIQMGTLLDIDRESLIIAYCKDKFFDDESQNIIQTFQVRKFANPNTLITAKEHERSDDYVFTSEQVKAMQDDLRLRLYLIYTYDEDDKTTTTRLREFFNCSKEDIEDITNKLAKLGLVHINGDEITRSHRHTTLPKSHDVFELRRALLIKNIEININPTSYISSCHTMISESSYRSFLSFLDFAEASLLKLHRDDASSSDRSHFQIALIANRVKNAR